MTTISGKQATADDASLRVHANHSRGVWRGRCRINVERHVGSRFALDADLRDYRPRSVLLEHADVIARTPTRQRAAAAAASGLHWRDDDDDTNWK